MYFISLKIRYFSLFVSALFLCFAINADSKNLGEILAQVEQHTPALKAARARTEVWKAAKQQAKSRYFGEIDALVRNNNYDSGRLINPITYPVNLQPKLFDDNQIGYGLNARLPVDINGRITAGVDSAGKQLEAARAQENDVGLQLLHDTAHLYHSLAGVKALESALKKQIDALTGHIKVAAVSIEAGRTARVEKLRLIADKEAVKGKLAMLIGQEQELRAKIAALMGTKSFFDIVIPINDPPEKTDERVDGTMNRPDIQTVKSRIEAADADIRGAVASRFPELNIDGSWIRNQGFNGEGDNTWTLSVQLLLPLWDGSGRRSAVAQAQAARNINRHQLAALQNQARAELVAAKADWHAAEISYRATIASVRAARETARIQTDRFIEGRLSAADLVDAEAALSGARSSRALALTHWWQAEDRLRHAIGLEPYAYQKKNNIIKKNDS